MVVMFQDSAEPEVLYMVVRLRRNTAADPAYEGIYYCEVMDNTETDRTVYVGIYNGGGMY